MTFEYTSRGYVYPNYDNLIMNTRFNVPQEVIDEGWFEEFVVDEYLHPINARVN